MKDECVLINAEQVDTIGAAGGDGHCGFVSKNHGGGQARPEGGQAQHAVATGEVEQGGGGRQPGQLRQQQAAAAIEFVPAEDIGQRLQLAGHLIAVIARRGWRVWHPRAAFEPRAEQAGLALARLALGRPYVVFQQVRHGRREVLVHAGGQHGAARCQLAGQSRQLVLEIGQLFRYSQDRQTRPERRHLRAPDHHNPVPPVGGQVVAQGQRRQRRVGPQGGRLQRHANRAVLVVQYQCVAARDAESVTLLQ